MCDGSVSNVVDEIDPIVWSNMGTVSAAAGEKARLKIRSMRQPVGQKMQLTRLLNAAADGDALATDQILPLVYDELRRLASKKMNQEAVDHTLQPTALVHEAYVRLLGADDGIRWDSRGHFYAAAAEAMRRILVESARRRDSLKRGGNMVRRELDEAIARSLRGDADTLLSLDEALAKLERMDADAAQLVKLRFFAGLTIDEAAAVLHISPRSAKRNWAFAAPGCSEKSSTNESSDTRVMTVDEEKRIFLEALDCGTESARTAYLDKACGRATQLRRDIDRLLVAHDRKENVVDQLPQPVARVRAQLQAVAGVNPNATLDYLANCTLTPDRTGELIGPYRLMEQIGEGGFGQVYMAEQHQPVRRRVALKVIKAGMDTREVIARFDAERQALAMMDPPAYRQGLDAGTTASGRPFFVMELVRGVPITEFCDQHELTTRERLELFVTVCQAVQHAHQKGIIHRDLKPSNVLVTTA